MLIDDDKLRILLVVGELFYGFHCRGFNSLFDMMVYLLIFAGFFVGIAWGLVMRLTNFK